MTTRAPCRISQNMRMRAVSRRVGELIARIMQKQEISRCSMTTGTGTFVTRELCRAALPEDFRFEAVGVPLTDDFTTATVLMRIIIDRQNAYIYKCD